VRGGGNWKRDYGDFYTGTQGETPIQPRGRLRITAPVPDPTGMAAPIRGFVREIATANPLWRAPRIHGELRSLGVDVSERRVSRLLEPHPRPASQTSKTFLKNHLASAGYGLLTVPTLTGRVPFVLVVLSHCRRRIVHFNIAEHPTAAWTAPQVVDAFPDDTAPRWLHRDRDSVYESYRDGRRASSVIR
jgi:transposase InsO family protein